MNEGLPCAKVSNIDLIFPNLFIDSGREENWEGNWTVIDYEWTFAFLIPKNFLIYRGLYYAYYQVLCRYGASLPELFQAAGLSEAETACYQKMEERFQQYLRKGALPVRGMQRLMGTRVIPVGEHATDGTDGSSAGVLEEAWLPVRSIRYHIDREELQGWKCGVFRMGTCKNLGWKNTAGQYPCGGCRRTCGSRRNYAARSA